MGIILSVAHYLQSSNKPLKKDAAVNAMTLDDHRSDRQTKVINEIKMMEHCANCYIKHRAETLIFSYIDYQFPWDISDTDMFEVFISLGFS